MLGRAAALGLDTFVELAERSTFAGVLGDTNPITVFAPDEAAFAALAPGELDALRDPQNIAALDAIIGRSIVPGELSAAVIESFGNLATVGGDLLQVDVFNSVIHIDGAAMVSSDLTPDNGILHTVDRVLEVPLEPMAELRDEGFGIFADLVELTGLDSELNLNAITVLAPTDAAFMALPPGELAALMDVANAADTSKRLRTHWLGGLLPISRLVEDGSRLNAEGALLIVGWDGASSPTVNGADLSSFNVPTTRGLIHRLEQVIDTPLTLDEALGDPSLQTLETLLFASSLQPVFEMAPAITVFAPNNDAFSNLAPGVFDSLVQPMNLEILRTLLRSHVGANALAFPSLAGGDVIMTLEGTEIVVSDPGTGALRLDDTADFVATDVYLTNGVLHVINAVLAADGL